MENSIFNLDKTFHQIILNFNKDAEERFHAFALQKLNQQIALGNNKFATYVDGRPSSLEGIYQAKKKIRFQFGLAAIKLAIRVMENELRSAIRKSSLTMRTNNLSDRITVFYAKAGGQFKIVNVSEINNFEPGDIVAIAPVVKYSGIALHWATQGSSRKKTKKYGLTKGRVVRGKRVGAGLDRKGRGFIGVAATRIRSIIGQQIRGAGISVRGQTSMALASIVWSGVNPKLVGHGVPAIFISYKNQQEARVTQV